MRALVVALVLAGSVARADVIDDMKKDTDGSQLDEHLAALKALPHDKKLDAVITAATQAKKVRKNKKQFAAANKKLQAALDAYVPDTPPPAPGTAAVSSTCKKIQFVADPAVGKVSVRAVLVDARRKQSRALAAANAAVTKADDYELAFTVKDRKADWKVVDENYEWKETNAKSGVVLATSRKSSRDVVKNDLLEIATPPGGETVVGKISGTIAWKNGATEETDKEDCAFELKLAK